MNDDLISRQAAIEAVHEEFDECLVWDESGQTTADEVERILYDLPTAEPKWIPVTERVPEENKPVLVTHHGKHQAFVSVDWIDPYTHEWNRTCNVTAWMPLPKPWKGESDA